MQLFIGASWFSHNRVPYVYNLSCVGVHGRHTTVQFDCCVALDMYIPERVLIRTGKSAHEMKQGMSESDALKLLHDVAEKAEHIICYSKAVCDLLQAISVQHKFKRKVNAITLSQYYKLQTGKDNTAEEILVEFKNTSKSTERTSLEDCNLLKHITSLFEKKGV